ncbi:hypothetical protein SAMN05216410_0707 [Sanguibacter gelidistatuariae]|uniref:Glycoprotein n=1 Tax=Sanguibacter gelidistatuariae TaxID=1814289 RepID=A0A1G6H4X9_9MICO|nr:DUF6049 family protein [Sanguibacter gelidistatuariae]SDB88985.1 hypothetical protein SAMN05216410_0707 [Sanguibacter gelidistatuariae]
MTALVRPIRRAGASIVGVLAVLAMALILTSLGAPLALPAAAAVPEPAVTSTAPVAVRLLSLSPEVTRPGDTLTVVAQIENTTTTDITSPVAKLSVSKYRYSTRVAFAGWEDLPESAPVGTTVQALPLPDTLAAGATTTITFSVEADSLTLMGGQVGWGPRGIAVSVTGEGTSYPATTPLGVLRTYLVWFPVADEEITPVDVSVLVPVVGPAFDPLDPVGSTPGLGEATDKTGRLSKVVASTEEFPAVAWAVDPAIVSAVARDGADEPATSPAATAWARHTLAASGGRDVFALPTFDQDWSAFAAAGISPPQREELPTGLSTWRTDLAWPAQAVPTTSVLRLAASAGTPLVVAAPGALQPDPELTYTPTGLASLATSSGTVTALVPDAVLSSQLAAPTQTSPAAARQRMVAELAIISRERPAEVRSILLTAPRSWTPTPEIAQAQLGGIDGVPWARLMPVSTLIDAPVPDVARSSPETSSTVQGALTRDELASLEATRAAVEHFAQVVPDPAALTTPVDAAALAATSVAWRNDPAGRTAAIDRLTAEADDVTSSISVVSQSDFTLISTGSSLPITVHNALDQPATVTVQLKPDDPRLVAEAPVTVVVPAGSDASAKVKVRAVGRGNVTVYIQILSPDGTLIASPASIGVRVRADWENLGTAIFAGLLVVLLGVGIWRTIHRGRSDRRASAAVVEQLENGDTVEPADRIDPVASVESIEPALADPEPSSEDGEPREHPHER